MHALIDSSTIIVSEDGETVIVAADDPAFPKVRNYLTEPGQEIDFTTVRALVNDLRIPAKAALAQAIQAVDGDGNGNPYRLVHGDPVDEVVLETAVRLTRDGDPADFTAFGAFLKRLERNPSAASRSQLFGWLKAGGFTITTEGLIVGYKSVLRSGLSQHGGREPVTVVHQDGNVDQVTGQVPYPVGATVFMPRHYVDDDRQSGCSVGLHVGTYAYAETFSQQTLVVLVDPADVVSVPADHGCAKMRVCRLRVAAQHDGEQISDAVIKAIRTIPDFDAGEEYAARPENEVVRPAFSIFDYPRLEGWADDYIDLDDESYDEYTDEELGFDDEDDDEDGDEEETRFYLPGVGYVGGDEAQEDEEPLAEWERELLGLDPAAAPADEGQDDDGQDDGGKRRGWKFW
jgi:hypothetical protein